MLLDVSYSLRSFCTSPDPIKNVPSDRLPVGEKNCLLKIELIFKHALYVLASTEKLVDEDLEIPGFCSAFKQPHRNGFAYV